MIVSPLWPAHAGNKPQPSNSSDSSSVANSAALASSKSQSASKSVAGAAANVTGVSALAKGGEASAVGGNATAEGGQGGAASADISGGVSLINQTRIPREAPPVGGAGGNSGGDDPSSRADDCMVGQFIGGTNDTGGISIGPVTMQGECYALVMYDWYAGRGMNEQAATAFCSARKHRAHYGGWFSKRREKCEAAIYQMLVLEEIEAEQAVSELGKPMKQSLSKKSG